MPDFAELLFCDDEEKLCVSWSVAGLLVNGILNSEFMMTVAKSDLGYEVPVGTYKVLYERVRFGHMVSKVFCDCLCFVY